jgi:two-component system response regulator HydG
MRGTVLVVDDRARPRRALATELEDAGFVVVQASDGVEAWKLFCRHPPDVVITDLVMPRSDGLELLGRIRSRSDVPVILFTAYGTVQSATAALKAGADEFIASPDVGIDDLVEIVASAMGERKTEPLPALEDRLAGSSQAMVRIRERIAGLSPLWTPVLISGESGTGHDAVANAVHELGSTASTKFHHLPAASVTLRGGIPLSGLVYLDGIENLAKDVQAELAERLLKAEASGFPEGRRIVASTDAHLLSLVREGTFDATLGSALLRFAIDLPPLRDRAEDVPGIADALVAKIGVSIGRRVHLSPAARDFLATRRWPANVRQLEKVLERTVAFSRGRRIRRQVVSEVLCELEDNVQDIREKRGARERSLLVDAIHRTGGNITRTAEVLGKSRSAVYRLLLKHDIPLNREH